MMKVHQEITTTYQNGNNFNPDGAEMFSVSRIVNKSDRKPQSPKWGLWFFFWNKV